MSQATAAIANISRSLFRAAVNAALQALQSNNSGASAPTETYAFMFWADTTANVLKVRNSANNNWIVMWPLDTPGGGFLTSAGGNLTGALNDSISTVASGGTPSIWTGTGEKINYTGTATATGFAAAPQAGASRTLILAGAPVFTAGSNMLIDGVTSGQNFTGAAGDTVEVIALTTTQFRLKPSRSNGTAVAGGSAATTTTPGISELATRAEAASRTDTVRAVTPDSLQGLIVQAAAISAAGQNLDFSAIPSWAKRITINFAGVSTSGTSIPIVQIGNTTPENTGYLGGGNATSGGGSSAAVQTTGFALSGINGAAGTRHGTMVLNNMGGNLWAMSCVTSLSNTPQTDYAAGSKTTGAAVNVLRITTVGGSDTYDAGFVSISWE